MTAYRQSSSLRIHPAGKTWRPKLFKWFKFHSISEMKTYSTWPLCPFFWSGFPFPSNKSTDSKTASGVVRPLISEVRPIMENKSLGRQQEFQVSERTTVQRLIQKKRTPVTESRRMISPVAKAAASHNASAGMRKAQSIHNISSEGKAFITVHGYTQVSAFGNTLKDEKDTRQWSLI